MRSERYLNVSAGLLETSSGAHLEQHPHFDAARLKEDHLLVEQEWVWPLARCQAVEKVRQDFATWRRGQPS
jgi:hypothetical protein